MRKLLILCAILPLLILSVGAEQFTAPQAPDDVENLMPVEKESFADGLLEILQNAFEALRPSLWEAGKICLSVLGITVLISILRLVPGNVAKTLDLTAVVAISALLLQNTKTMIGLGVETVGQLSDYGKLLIPVMAGALAAQGGMTASASLYAGTAAVDAVLCSIITYVLVPMLYALLALGIAARATEEKMLSNMENTVKSAMSWGLKTILYIFTGYLGITGVISGATDATAMKATKLTISGMVPMVGSILADASEAVLVGAGVVKNAVGIYGLLAVCAICIVPFLRLGVQYLLLKLTAAACQVFDVKPVSALVECFSGAMGFLMGMTGAVCLLFLISTVCFMRGVG